MTWKQDHLSHDSCDLTVGSAAPRPASNWELTTRWIARGGERPSGGAANHRSQDAEAVILSRRRVAGAWPDAKGGKQPEASAALRPRREGPLAEHCTAPDCQTLSLSIVTLKDQLLVGRDLRCAFISLEIMLIHECIKIVRGDRIFIVEQFNELVKAMTASQVRTMMQ